MDRFYEGDPCHFSFPADCKEVTDMMKDKKVLVFGMARSGIAAAKLLLLRGRRCGSATPRPRPTSTARWTI